MRRLAVIVNDACAWDSRGSYSQARARDEQAARLASVGVLFIDCELLRLEVKNQLLGNVLHIRVIIRVLLTKHGAAASLGNF